jgi:BMFP domain-containing protein YqiC
MQESFVRDLAERLVRNVPQGMQAAGEDLQRNFESVLQTALSRLDLVTREEFDVQRRLLERSREKLDALEAELARLQAQAGAASPSANPAANGESEPDTA